MDRFFNPASVVVVGASNAPANLGASICGLLKGHLKYPGNAFVVNSRGEDVRGCQGFTSIAALPLVPDLAVVIVAAGAVPGVVRDCADKGIRAVIIESSGFSECDAGGQALQSEIDAIASGCGMRIIGPNCLGTLSTRDRFSCFYGFNPGLVEMGEVILQPGEVSYIFQSGGMAIMVSESLHDDLARINRIVSIGNRSDVDEADLISFFQDDGTGVIGVYLENVGNGRRLMEAARRSVIPVLAYKAGSTEEGARAALSHTAGLAGDDRIFDAACRQSGIIRLKSVNELHALPKVFLMMPGAPGRRVAVFTNSGAFGSIGSDLVVTNGLQMAGLSPETLERIGRAGRIFNASNPIDIGPAPAQAYLDIFEILLSAPEVDCLLAMLCVWQPFVIDCLVQLPAMCRRFGKPAAIYTPDAISKSIGIRLDRSIPLFETAELAVRALWASHSFVEFEGLQQSEDFEQMPDPGTVRQILDAAIGQGRMNLSEYESKKVLAAAGVPVTREILARSRSEALFSAAEIGYPVVLKGVSPEIVHKTEMDMVRVNLADPDEVALAYDDLAGRGISLDGVLVQEMVRGVREFVIGMVRDPNFGPCVMFGVGGILAEAIRDVVFRVAPISMRDALEMIGEIRSARLLDSFRGWSPVDREELACALVGVGQLAVEYPCISAIDVNPLIVRDGIPVAADASIFVEVTHE